jgi:hypothetical protein
MPQKKAPAKASKATKKGKAPSTQAGKYVREEMEEMKQGNPNVRSPQQAIAIGLSRARKEGVPIPPRKSAAKKAASKKSSGKKVAAKKTAPRKASAKKTGAKKASATKKASKKAATKKR